MIASVARSFLALLLCDRADEVASLGAGVCVLRPQRARVRTPAAYRHRSHLDAGLPVYTSPERDSLALCLELRATSPTFALEYAVAHYALAPAAASRASQDALATFAETLPASCVVVASTDVLRDVERIHSARL